MAVSANNFIDINSDFFSKVKAKNSDVNGELTNNGLVRRLSNPICLKCHEDYAKKYPNEVFNIKCNGIYGEEDYQDIVNKAEASGIPITLEQIKELKDPVYWATKYLHVTNKKGDIVPFVPRWYQEEMIKCTASRAVDRIGRGGGKSQVAVADELWRAMTRKNFPILVLCPNQTQSELWWNEINFQLDNSPELANSILGKKQAPYYQIKFLNGSSIGIFTAGSGSGKGANTIRGQNPERVRVDEQDYLHENDYKALNALIRRKPHSTFHGSSTPTGLRTQYWKMCTQFNDYKEFYFPITVHPDWTSEMEKECIAEAGTLDNYRHEYLAEFSDPATGVFKAAFINPSLRIYTYDQMKYDPTKKYYMGVDWNGEGTGTRICILEFDPNTRVRRKVDTAIVDSEKNTTKDSIATILSMNKKWHCDDVFIDAGFGFAQDEWIRDIASKSQDTDTKRLKNVRSIDFGGSLEFNKLVPNRKAPGKITPDDDAEFKTRTKPFMVEGVVMAFEMGLVEISNDDRSLEDQLRAYQVVSYSDAGQARKYEAPKKIGDHDLDAFMLAMLAIELKYGIWHTQETLVSLAKIAYTTGFGPNRYASTRSPEVQPSPLNKIIPRNLEDSLSKKEDERPINSFYGSNYKPSVILRNGSGFKSRASLTSRTSIFGPNQGRRSF